MKRHPSNYMSNQAVSNQDFMYFWGVSITLFKNEESDLNLLFINYVYEYGKYISYRMLKLYKPLNYILSDTYRLFTYAMQLTL